MTAARLPQAYSRVTAADCRRLGQMFRESLSSFGFTPNPMSDLARMIKALEWLGSFPADAYHPDTAYAADRARSFEAFGMLEQARRTAEALTLAREIPGSEKAVLKLRTRLNRLVDQDAAALDYFFELDIAYRLAMRGVPVAFEEPDLTVGRGSLKVGLACKRPRNLRQMRQRLRDATRQVLRQPFPGLIVISLEAMLHKSGDPKKPTVIYHVPTPDKLGEVVNPMIDEWILRAEPEIQKAFDEGVWGILFCGIVTGIADRIEPGFSATIYEWFRRTRSSPAFPDCAELLENGIFRPLDARSVA